MVYCNSISSGFKLPIVDRKLQLARIHHLKKKYPITSKYRGPIRNFIRRACVQFEVFEPVLDVGAGYRSNEPEVCADKPLSFYTLDIDEGYCPDFVGDAADNNLFQDNTFGSIICTELLEHVANPYLIIENIHRMLRPSGLLLLTVPCNVPIHEKRSNKDFGHRFSPNQLADFLGDFFSFEVLTTSGDCPNNPWGVFAAARKPSLSKQTSVHSISQPLANVNSNL